jgi:hypothetical protein
MRTRAALLLVAAVLLAAAGCGVPSDSKPRAVGPAPGLAGAANPPGSVVLPSPAGANTPRLLVERFLQAGAAADWDPARLKDRRVPDAIEYAKQFLAPELRQTWKPDEFVLVVDPEIKPGLSSVEVTLRPVGVLDENGSLDPKPPVLTLPSPFMFQTEPASVSGQNLLLSNAPNFLMLSLEGLESLFEMRPVYYWDNADRNLVPDLRYVSKGISDEKRVKAIIDQWLAGPSDFLKRSVSTPIVPDTADNPLLDGNKVTVNFPTPVSLGSDPPKALRHLAWQIRWSVHRPSSQVTVEIQFDGRSQLVDNDETYLEANPALPRQARSVLDDDRLFAVLDGKVIPVFANTSVPAVLDAPENSGVVSAAINRPNRTAALVRQGTGGNLELWLGRNSADPRYVRADLPATTAMSRPSYLPGTDSHLLIAAGGVLYDVAPDGSKRDIQLSTPGNVTAVAVAPDGARVALVTDRGVFVAPLDTKATSIGTARELYLPGVTDVRGVGWVYEHRLVVASAGAGAAALTDVAIDNGYLKAINLSNLGGAQLTQVSALPGNPIDGIRGNVVVETVDRGDRQAFYQYAELTAIELPPSARPSPSPSASQSASAGPGVPVKRLVAPFYVDDVE